MAEPDNSAAALEARNYEQAFNPWLLGAGTGLGGALIGGAITALGKKRDDETRGDKMRRVLKNALISGVVGGGLGVGGGLSYNLLSTANTQDERGLIGQLSNAVSGIGKESLLALGAHPWSTGTALGAAAGIANPILSRRLDSARLASIARRLGESVPEFKSLVVDGRLQGSAADLRNTIRDSLGSRPSATNAPYATAPQRQIANLLNTAGMDRRLLALDNSTLRRLEELATKGKGAPGHVHAPVLSNRPGIFRRGLTRHVGATPLGRTLSAASVLVPLLTGVYSGMAGGPTPPDYVTSNLGTLYRKKEE